MSLTASILKPLNPSTLRGKRKKRFSYSYQNPRKSLELNSQFVIDDSSPVKKAKKSHSENSHWFLSRIHKKNERRQSACLGSKATSHDDDTLINQLKKVIQLEKSMRESWLHSTTSGLKNKIKESYQARTHVILNLKKITSRYNNTFANAVVKEAVSCDVFAPEDKVVILFPCTLAQNMGLSTGSVIKLTSPWKTFEVDGCIHIINPFWINVVDRSKEVLTAPLEKTILEWSCPCRENFGVIDLLDCDHPNSQQLSQSYSQL